MLIEFAENCGLDSKDKKLVREWPHLRERLRNSAEESPFVTSRVVIRGAAMIGSGEKRTILMVDARVFFSLKNQTGEQSYHLTILPSSSSLLLIFQDVGDKPATDTKATAENLYLVVVRQSRWAADDADSPEPPSGQAEKDEAPVDTAWREAKEEIGPELFEQLCRDYTPRPLTASDAVSFYRTTAPDTMVSGAYEAFACVVSVTSGQLIEIREKITRSGAGGLREEGEETRPELLPLADIIDGGGISIISHVVVEFMRGFGISVPSKKQILPLPYIRLRE